MTSQRIPFPTGWAAMSGPVRAHLIFGCEDFATTSFTRKVSLDMNICVVEILHALCLVNVATFIALEPFTLWNIRRPPWSGPPPHGHSCNFLGRFLNSPSRK